MPVAGEIDSEFKQRVKEKRKEHDAKTYVKRAMAMKSLECAEIRLKARFNKMNTRLKEQEKFTGFDDVSVRDVAPRTFLAKNKKKGGAVAAPSKDLFALQLDKKKDDNLNKMMKEAIHDTTDHDEQRQDDPADGEVRPDNSYEEVKDGDDESGVVRLHLRSHDGEERAPPLTAQGFWGFWGTNDDMIGTKRQLVLEEGIYSYTSDVHPGRTTSWNSGDHNQRSPTTLSPNSSGEEDDDQGSQHEEEEGEQEGEEDNGFEVGDDNRSVVSYGSATLADLSSGAWVTKPVENEAYCFLCCCPGERL